MKKSALLITAVFLFIIFSTTEVNAQWTGTAPNATLSSGYSKVGIGIATPANPLEIQGTATDGEYSILLKNNGATPTRTYLTSFLDKSSIQTDRDFTLRNNNGGWHDAFVFKYSGNVGIGTTNPGSVLHIASGNASAYLNIERPNSSTESGIAFIQAATTQFYLFVDDANNSLKIRSTISGELDVNPRMEFPFTSKNIYMGASGGNVGIGTTAPDERLSVKGKIHTQEIKVDLLGAMVPDYVFRKDYKLPSLKSVESYIHENQHLPEIPSAKEMEDNGMQLKEMNLLLLKKIEELTLYVIEQQKEIEALKTSTKK